MKCLEASLPLSHTSRPAHGNRKPFKFLSLIVTLVGLLVGSTSVHTQRGLLPGFKVELILGTEQIEHPSVVIGADRENPFVGEDPMASAWLKNLRRFQLCFMLCRKPT